MKKHIETPSRFIHYCIHCAMEHEESEMQEVMEKFLSNERKKMKGRDMEWISVDEKPLPKKGKVLGARYNTAFQLWEYGVIMYYEGSYLVVPTRDMRLHFLPTHWMPLPEPPKE